MKMEPGKNLTGEVFYQRIIPDLMHVCVHVGLSMIVLVQEYVEVNTPLAGELIKHCFLFNSPDVNCRLSWRSATVSW